ncbi:hypothetical protein, partial [Macellibacteroides fermentans]|uniref:hypothetical protein n=1 Tax=Macellibacteroides fermentans TaxID=879969 RepID=UPI00406C63F8
MKRVNRRMSLKLKLSRELIDLAYKKLKSSVYFDKTLLPLRDELVNYEGSNDVNLKLDELYSNLCQENGQAWEAYETTILTVISTYIYPKKLIKSVNTLIINAVDEKCQVERCQYFIKMSIEGHVLGVLWLLLIGTSIDDRKSENGVYEHSYGNRLCGSLIDKNTGELVNSPHLFEPYFSQYQSWRDKALDDAQNNLKSDQDVIISALDLKSFYYSVDISAKKFNETFPEKYKQMDDTEREKYERLHQFVYKVIARYSTIVSRISTDQDLRIQGRCILPIGFLPSNLLSNWVLKPFDDAVVKRWNPIYYGRYVDDIIIVDKVEKNSQCYYNATKTGSEVISKDSIIQYYFCGCPAKRNQPSACKDRHVLLKILPKPKKVQDTTNASLQRAQKANVIDNNSLKSANQKKDTIIEEKTDYILNGDLLGSQLKSVEIQNNKVKIFYFRHGATQALIDCFKSQIAKNASEFRYLPDVDHALENHDFSSVFSLHSDDTIHKLRGVTSVEIDKFELSKFLGKYRKVGNMIRDRKEVGIDKSLISIFNKRSLLENYSVWERLLEIMVVNERLDSYDNLVSAILDSIINMVVESDKVNTTLDERFSNFYANDALFHTLFSAVTRTLALIWGENATILIKKIGDRFLELQKSDISHINPDIFTEFSVTNIDMRRKMCCETRMVNKYIVPVPIDCINLEQLYQGKMNISLCKLE